MSVVVKSHGLSSLFSAAFLISKGVKVSLIDQNPVRDILGGDIKLFPYELPVFNLEQSGFFKELKPLFLKDKEPLGIVFRGRRFDLSNDYLPASFIGGLESIIKSSLTFNRDITSMYAKHDLSDEMRRVVDAVLFLMSGIAKKNMPVRHAAKLITGTLDGLNISCDGVYSLRGAFLKLLSEKVDLEGSGDDEYLIDDHDEIKGGFIKHFDEVKGKYSDLVRYPFSVYVKVRPDFIPEAMNRWTLFIEEDDIYTVRCFFSDDSAVVRVTCFMAYGAFHLKNEIHKEKIIDMLDVFRELIPLASLSDYSVYPDPNSVNLGQELSRSFANLKHGDVVYESSPPWYTGFEGCTNKGVQVAEKLLRGYKDETL